jgi:uncharacterized membrane protein
MTRALLLYLLTVPVFLVIDFTWLGVVARDLYRTQLGGLMTDAIVWPAAILFYLLFCVGLLVFAILPALDAGSLARAALLGAAFGFFTYMTYDLTNLATLRDWPVPLVVVDIAWGTALGATVSTIVYALGSRLVPG